MAKKKPDTDNGAEAVLWGFSERMGTGCPVVKISRGTMRHVQAQYKQRQQERHWISLGIYKAGDVPAGLQAQAAAYRRQHNIRPPHGVKDD